MFKKLFIILAIGFISDTLHGRQNGANAGLNSHPQFVFDNIELALD